MKYNGTLAKRNNRTIKQNKTQIIMGGSRVDSVWFGVVYGGVVGWSIWVRDLSWVVDSGDGIETWRRVWGVRNENDMGKKMKWAKDSRCILGNEAGIKIFLYLVSKLGTKPVYAWSLDTGDWVFTDLRSLWNRDGIRNLEWRKVF